MWDVEEESLSMKSKIIIFSLTIFLCLMGKFAWNEVRDAEQSGIKDFTLLSPSGPVSLKSYKGKIVLMYFGFLNCPEACPNTFTNVAQAFKKLSPEQLDQIVLLFITLDPERDDLNAMKEYSHYFHPNIVPLRGELDYVLRVAKFYNAKFRKVELDGGMEYTIDHSLNLLILNRKGELFSDLGQIHTSTSILADIENAFKELP